MPTDDLIIQHTKNWINSFIIKLTICPFAKREFERGSLRILVSNTQEVAQGLEDLIREIERLNKQSAIETSLLILPFLGNDFLSYLDFVDLAEDLLREQGYEGVYQLATFHPDYCFADVDSNDVSNYTNRSPYPMLHILREETVEKAIHYYGDTSKIPEENIKTMHELGLMGIKKILLSCKPDALK